MRFLSPILLVALLAGCAKPPSYQRKEAQLSDPVQDIFDNRALILHTLPATGPDPAIAAALLSSNIGKAYSAIRPERSILAYDCPSKWCSQHDFSFESIFTEAARLANPAKPDPGNLASFWYDAANAQDDTLSYELPKAPLAKLRLQLLAVANRMDLANFRSGNWTGAEIHFVYGVIPYDPGTPQNLTVILEFQLPPSDQPTFRSIAQTWFKLSGATDDQYGSQLLAALRSSGFSLKDGIPTKTTLVRTRINHMTTGGPWQLSQLLLDPASHTFLPARLNDQISKKVAQDSRLYLDLWKKVETTVSSGVLQYSIGPELLEAPIVQYNHAGRGMGTPPGVCNASKKARDVLALQQCTGCHTVESNTNFAQIHNRKENESSVLSEFLIGKGAVHPRLVDLYYGNQNIVTTLSIRYTNYVGSPPCMTQNPNNVSQRTFHDLARRTLFLAAVQTGALNSNGLPAATKFSTFFTE